MKKIILPLLFTITVFSGEIFGQVTYAKPDEFNEVKSRPLIIQTIEFNEKLIAKWEKKKLKAKTEEEKNRYSEMVLEYKSFITSYNENIKSVMEKYWGFNKKILYKTSEEVDELRKNKSDEYSIFWYSESTSGTSLDGAAYFPNLKIPTFNYSRLESGTMYVDYSYFIHYTGHRKINEFTESDILISIKLMKNHINTIQSEGQKKYTFTKFTKSENEKKCTTLKGKEVFIDTANIHKKSSLKEIQSNYVLGKVTASNDKEIQKSIMEEKDVLIDLIIPYQISSGSIGPLSMASIIYNKVIVNVKTGKVYSSFGASTGELTDHYHRIKEFSNLSKCE